MTADGRAPAVGGRRWVTLLASVALAGVGYLAFSVWAGWSDVLHAAAQVGWTGLALLLALSCANYALRFLRWQLFLRALGVPQPWRPSLQIYLAGFALTTTPGKVGEAVRSLFLKRRGAGHGSSVAAFVSERLSDLLAIVVLCALGWNIAPALRPLIVLSVALVALPLLLMSRRQLLQRWHAQLQARRGRLARGLQLLLRLLLDARRCHRPRVLALATALSLLAWSAEAFAFDLLLHWLQVDTSLAFAAFVYAAGMLAGALSFLPGGLGGTEATMTALLIWAGSSQPVAVAATVFIRLTTLWFAVALGIVALLRLLPSLQLPLPAARAAAEPA